MPQKDLASASDTDTDGRIDRESDFTTAEINIINGVAGSVATETDKNIPTGSAPTKKITDLGKVLALAKAGWTVKQIAEEMNLTAVEAQEFVRQAIEKYYTGKKRREKTQK